MSKSIALAPVKPLGTLIPPLVSTSDYLIGRNLVEIITQQNDYSYNGQSRIVFDIDSDNSFWNPSDSYVRLELTTQCLIADGQGTLLPDPLAYMCEGAIHAFMKHYTWEVRGQTQIHRMVRANELYAMFSNMHDSPEFVDRVLTSSGDSANHEILVDTRSRFIRHPDQVTYDATNGIWTLGGDDTVGDIETGDYFYFDAPGDILGVNVPIYVTNVTDSTHFITTTGGGLGDLTAGNIATAYFEKRIRRFPNRSLLVNQTKVVLLFQPFNAISRSPQWIPLFALRGGLRFTIDLERDERVLKTTNIIPDGHSFQFSYTISNPVYVIDLIQPNPSLQAEYVALYQTSGLDYQFTSFAYQLDAQLGSVNGQWVNRFQVGRRSCRYVVQKITDARMETPTNNAVTTANNVYSPNNVGSSSYYVDSMSQGLRAGLGELLFTIGSQRYPYANIVTFKNDQAWEIMTVMERSLQTMDMSLYGRRFDPVEWTMAIPLETGDPNAYGKPTLHFLAMGGNRLRDEATRFYIVIDIARDTTPWAGFNLQSTPLQMEYNFNYGSKNGNYYLQNWQQSYHTNDASAPPESALTTRYFHSWVCYDLLWSISEQGTVVRS